MVGKFLLICILYGSRSELKEIHANLEQLIDSPESLPAWNMTVIVMTFWYVYSERTYFFRTF